jgi:Domain of unknown function (DUF3536)/Glycosyl hydrolase family 57
VTTPRSIVIHGHFYQPPREDPWLDEVEAEPSAAPFHDWNQRIEQECYRAVAAARVPGPGGRIARIANNYEWMSFNFGPTLLEWLERAAPDTYADVIAADRASIQRLGHGNAVAMPYHHSILPLCSRREKVTEVRWGITDFERRFDRLPEGMWLPETAVDEETLDVLAQEGIRFTILAPHQVDPVPPRGLPGKVQLPGGRTITVFVYDGSISHDVAFGPLVRDAMAWSERLLAVPVTGPAPALVSVATDGETYGHHHPFGEMSLARTLEWMQETPGVVVENFASFLARAGAEHQLRLVAATSWSCSHGVERWRSDCACKMAPDQPTNQRWRAPLREAVAWLTGACHEIFDREAPLLLHDPSAALAGFGAVIGSGGEAVRQYGRTMARGSVTEEQLIRTTELLEMERGALRTLTSCAWFFDDIGGLETLQVLRYAAWVIDLAGPDSAFLEEGFTRRLAPAESNVQTLGTGRDIYLHRARPHVPPPIRIAAGLAAARAFAPAAASSLTWLLEGPNDAVILTNQRTGRRHMARVELEQSGLELRVTVRSPLFDSPVALALADLPDRQRTAVTATLLGKALERVLSADDLAALGRGEDLKQLIQGASMRRVASLGGDWSGRAQGEVAELLDILEQLGQAVPFEVQTLFYRVWQNGIAKDPGMVDLARRLGFVGGWQERRTEGR